MKHYLETLKINANKEIDMILNDDKLTDNDKVNIIDGLILAMHQSADNIKALYEHLL